MNIFKAFLGALTASVAAVALLAAPSAEAAMINYRSIGINSVELFNAGTASVGMGLTQVTFSGGGPLPDTVGRGDEIVIDDEELYILSRDSDSRLTLQTPALKEHVADEFAIRRAYTSIQAWVGDRKGDLVREDRLEVGVCYNDGPFASRKHGVLAHIRGSRTDRDHFMWLTAADMAQHKGAAGKGVVLDGLDRARCGILIEDDYTRVDGLELKNFGHCFAPGAVVVRNAKGVVLERLLVHDFDVRRRETFGIKGGMHSDFLARNCIIYNGGTAGIVTRWKTSRAAVENCTVFDMQGKGVDEGQGLISAVNTISMGSRADFAIRRGTQSNNISSDGTAAGPGSVVFLPAADQFVSVSPGAEDFHLKDTSAAVDAGKNLAAQQAPANSIARTVDVTARDSDLLDIDGTDRAEEEAWDIGADEVESAPEGVWYVDPAQAGDGTSWKTAFATLQQAFSAAVEGGQIWVKAGVYALTSELAVTKPLSIYGGFAGTERNLAKRKWREHPTILDGRGVSRCLNLNAKGILISGVEIRSGLTSGTPFTRRGGAVYAANGAQFTFEDCRFSDNTAQGTSGGAIFAGGNASGAIRNCLFAGNRAASGGAVYAEQTILSITNCIFVGNTAMGTTPTNGGGAVYNKGSKIIFTNCNFLENHADSSYGGGVHSYYNTTTEIANSVFWGNTAKGGAQIYDGLYFGVPAVTVVSFSDIDQEGYAGLDGNIHQDPLFVDIAAEDFRLQAASPCIDAGTLNAAELPELDFEGDPRAQGKSVDMGAFEFGS
jgi:predicted outer membrane repeat protein